MELTWKSFWRYALGISVIAVMLWLAFVGGRRIPLLSNVDLGFHELGHLVATPLGTTIHFLAGSLTQVMVPLGLAAYFWLRSRDRLASSLMLAWAATSLQDVSVYIADAPHQRLPLIGGDHDWAFLLGSRTWDIIHLAQPIASFVWFTGLMVGLAAWALCASAPLGRWLRGRRGERRRRHIEGLPVREVRNPPSRGENPL